MGNLLSASLDAAMRWFAPGSPYRNVILALATLIVFVYIHRTTRRKLAGYVSAQAHKEENATRFLRVYDAVWTVVIAIVFIIAAGGSLALLGLSVAFLGTILGWSLQVPIRGLAAWVMLVLKKPFRVGDRISVAGIVGDVTETQLNHILLNQVGGTVAGEEKSGRGILVPNAMLFDSNIINYNYFAQKEIDTPTPVSRFMLDEVLVRITFGSDFELAKRLCVEAAKKATDDLLGETDQAPFTRSEFMAWGVLIRVQYKTTPAQRQEVSSRVTELVWAAFREHEDKVQFCYPVSVADIEGTPEEHSPPMIQRNKA